MKPWVEKYRPRNLSDVIGQTKAVSEVHAFFRNFKMSRKNAILLDGPPGSGKTSLIYALANQDNLEIVEINASDFRNKSHVEEILKPATQQGSIFGTNKIILVDEVDSMSGQKDRGGVKAIVDVIKNSKFPIFMTANDAWSSKLKTLRNHCLITQLNKINYLSIAKYLQNICVEEDVKFEEIALKKIAMSCNGDLRAAINDLQVMASDGVVNDADLTLWGREKEETILNVLKLIYKSFDSKVTLDAVNDLKDFNELPLWLEQNTPYEYSGKALFNAMDAISWSDIFTARIRLRQHWRFMVYIKYLVVVGVQQAKNEASRNLIKYARPGLILRMWSNAAKRKKAEGISAQLEGKLHCSAKSLRRDFLPYLNFIEINNKDMYDKLASSLGI